MRLVSAFFYGPCSLLLLVSRLCLADQLTTLPYVTLTIDGTEHSSGETAELICSYAVSTRELWTLLLVKRSVGSLLNETVATVIFTLEENTYEYATGQQLSVTIKSYSMIRSNEQTFARSIISFQLLNLTVSDSGLYECVQQETNLRSNAVSLEVNELTKMSLRRSDNIRLLLSDVELHNAAQIRCVVNETGTVESFQLLRCKNDELCDVVYDVAALPAEGSQPFFSNNRVNSSYLSRFSYASGYVENNTTYLILYLMNAIVSDDGSLFRCSVKLSSSSGAGDRYISLASDMASLRVFAGVTPPVTLSWNEPVVEHQPTLVYCSGNVGYPRGQIQLMFGSPQQRDLVNIDDSQTSATYYRNADGTYFAHLVFVVVLNRTSHNIAIRCDAENSLPSNTIDSRDYGGNPVFRSFASSTTKGIYIQHPPSTLFFRIVSSNGETLTLYPKSTGCPPREPDPQPVRIGRYGYIQCVTDASPVQRVRWVQLASADPSTPPFVSSSDGATLVAPVNYYASSAESSVSKYMCQSTWESLTVSVSLCGSILLRPFTEMEGENTPSEQRQNFVNGEGYDLARQPKLSTDIGLDGGLASYNTLRILLAVGGCVIGILLANIAFCSVRALKRRRIIYEHRRSRLLNAAAYRALAHPGPISAFSASDVTRLHENDALQDATDAYVDERPPAYCELVEEAPPAYCDCSDAHLAVGSEEQSIAAPADDVEECQTLPTNSLEL